MSHERAETLPGFCLAALPCGLSFPLPSGRLQHSLTGALKAAVRAGGSGTVPVMATWSTAPAHRGCAFAAQHLGGSSESEVVAPSSF